MLIGWLYLICRRAGLWHECSDTQGNLCVGTSMADNVQMFVFKERREAGMRVGMAHLCGVTAEKFSPACGSKVSFIIRSTSPEDVCHS